MIDTVKIDFAKMDGLVPGIVQDAKTGEMLSATAAQKPARGSATAHPMRQTRNCDAANNRMKGKRTAIGASVPSKWAAPHESHQLAGG